MNNVYYSQNIFIPQVDENDNVVGTIERWKAHKKGILHRGLTVGLLYKDQYLCQHRKHPVFNGFIDLTASTHPKIINGKIESIEEATYKTLNREWNIQKDEIVDLSIVGKVLYNSQFEEFIEHEICYFLKGEIKNLPSINAEYAFGFSLLPKEVLTSSKNAMSQIIAPWVKQAFQSSLY